MAVGCPVLIKASGVQIVKTKIFYFSGTGNSFILARDIAARLNAEMISIPKVIHDEKIYVDAQRMGVVFPSYLAALFGVPLMVEKFIEKITNLRELDIFAVCNSGGYESMNALPPLYRLQDIIRKRGGHLGAGFTVRLPMNNLDYDHIPVPIERDTGLIVVRSRRRVDAICSRILQGKGTSFKIPKAVLNRLMAMGYGLMHKPVLDSLKRNAGVPLDSTLGFWELIPMTDNGIQVNDNCIGCGTCQMVCPAKNIRLKDGKPEFLHTCEMCFACDEWCPRGAIQHWGRAEGIKYHHPDAKLKDMLAGRQ